ncbi:MAG: mechanosensitive ion channel domain-containing protein [Gammaproteobacteria bacterium]
MPLVRNLLLPFLLLFFWSPTVLAVSSGLSGADSGDKSAEGVEATDRARIEALIQSLEDPGQREDLIRRLRVLTDVQDEQSSSGEDVKTAASEAVASLSRRVAKVAEAANSLVDVLRDLPSGGTAVVAALSDPEQRMRWLTVAARLLSVLGAGILAAWLVRRVIARGRGGAQGQCRTRPVWCRLWNQSVGLLLDAIPIAAFAAASFVVLAWVDPQRETRYVAVVLINAALLLQATLAAANFFFAPGRSRSRLWEFSDETAHYLYHWVRRLAGITVFGVAALESARYLGLEAGAYQMLLRLLGLLVLGLFLVLIAQNRQAVRRAIAGDAKPVRDDDGVSADEGVALDIGVRMTTVRRGLARVWHLIASVYVIAVYGIWTLRVEDGALFIVRATVLTLVIAAMAQVLMRGVDHMLRRGLRLNDDLRASLPGLEMRLNRYFPVFARVLNLILALFATLLVLDVWGLDALHWLTEGAGRPLISAGINIALIIVLALFVWELAGGALERHIANSGTDLTPGSTRARTLLSVARNALIVTLFIVTTLMVLSELGINIAPLLAGAGVLGLAIGFGSQRLVQDVINGAFILFQDLMAVGDVVKLGDRAGVVEALSIRTVRLRDLSGTVHTIPFSSIDTVSNLTREFSFHVFDIGIAYREDVDEVIALINAVGEELQADPEIGPLVLEPLEVFGLDQFGDSALVIKGRIKTKPIKQWQVGRAFNRLVKQRFDERGIEIPFPHRTIYFGAEKDGGAPPAYVQLDAMRGAIARAAE